MLRLNVVTVLIILFCAAGSSAVSWEHVYECKNLPDDPALGNGIWKVFGVSDIGQVTKDGELHITSQ